jgi:mannose-6-phosphate isomerase-like protein (cupin superfamily)
VQIERAQCDFDTLTLGLDATKDPLDDEPGEPMHESPQCAVVVVDEFFGNHSREMPLDEGLCPHGHLDESGGVAPLKEACLLAASGEHFTMVSSARSGDGVFRFRWVLAPGRKGPPPHTHPHETETFHIVSGTLRIFIGGKPRDLEPGDTFAVPRGVQHGFLNPGREPLVADVSLDGHLQEDSLVPLAVHLQGGARMGVGLILGVVVRQFHSEAIGAAPPLLATIVKALARLLLACGARGLEPVIGWEQPGFRAPPSSRDARTTT